MILFYWADFGNQAPGEQMVVSSSRIFVNIDLAARWSIGYGKMEFVLDTLSLWGGSDKRDACEDNTTTLSWEFPVERHELVKSIVEKWKTDQKDMPAWHGELFCHKAAKQPMELT